MARSRTSAALRSGARHSVEVAMRAAGWARALPDAERLVVRAVCAVLNDARLGVAAPAEVSVVLAGDSFVRRLNRDHRGQDKPTNLLSFPLERASRAAVPGRRTLLGDVVIALGTVRREARAEGKSVAHHAVHLLVHGTLHLLGHDHLRDREAAIMEAHEIRILAGLGVSNPYRPPAAEARAA